MKQHPRDYNISHFADVFNFVNTRISFNISVSHSGDPDIDRTTAESLARQTFKSAADSDAAVFNLHLSAGTTLHPLFLERIAREIEAGADVVAFDTAHIDSDGWLIRHRTLPDDNNIFRGALMCGMLRPDCCIWSDTIAADPTKPADFAAAIIASGARISMLHGDAGVLTLNFPPSLTLADIATVETALPTPLSHESAWYTDAAKAMVCGINHRPDALSPILDISGARRAMCLRSVYLIAKFCGSSEAVRLAKWLYRKPKQNKKQ